MYTIPPLSAPLDPSFKCTLKPRAKQKVVNYLRGKMRYALIMAKRNNTIAHKKSLFTTLIKYIFKKY